MFMGGYDSLTGTQRLPPEKFHSDRKEQNASSRPLNPETAKTPLRGVSPHLNIRKVSFRIEDIFNASKLACLIICSTS